MALRYPIPINPWGIQPYHPGFGQFPRFAGAFGLPGAGPGPLQPSTPTAPYPRQPVPATPPPGNMGPIPPGYYPPHGGGGCGPMMPPGCGMPQSQASYEAQEMGRALQCEVEQAQMMRGVRAVALDQVPQIPLATRTAAGVVIPAGTTSTLALLPAVTPSVPMCLTRFEVARSIAAFFVIESMRTARTELLADGAGVPADSFAVDAFRTPKIELPRLNPGTFITLIVTNVDGADHPFFGAWWGIPLDQPGPCL